jgi:hypothetical protein
VETIIIALIVLGILGLIIALLLFVHKRDQNKEAEKKDLV